MARSSQSLGCGRIADNNLMDLSSRPNSARAPLGFLLLIALLALCAAGKAILYDTMDPDCFWHLRVADQLHRDGIGPIVDDLSFASVKQPWTPYSWLAELGMKAVWDVGGYRAAVATQAIMQAAIVIFLALSCLEMQRQPRMGGKPKYLAAAMSTAAGAFLMLPYLSFRPVTAAFVILWVCTWLILRDRRMEERSWAVWAIVPLTLLLTNIHLFAFFMPAVVLVMWMGAAWERVYFLGKNGHSISSDNPSAVHTGLNGRRESVMRYGVMLILVSLAYLGTPMLPGLIKTAFFYGAQDRMVSGPVIAEMQSFASGPLGFVAGTIVAGAFICMITRWKSLRVGEVACFVVGSLLLFKLGRFAPVFVMGMCPVLAATWPRMKDRILGKPVLCAVLSVILVVGCVRIAGAFPKREQTLSAWLNRHGPDAPGYPTAAAEFVERNLTPSTGKIINEFSWGGYLAYELGDKYKILLDGRTQVYPAELWQATYLSGPAQKAHFFAGLKADAAVLPAGKSQFHAALADLGWTSVYHDQRAEVMLPPNGEARIEP
jgi:hypothetical protein